jgi:hypothetical protein
MQETMTMFKENIGWLILVSIVGIITIVWMVALMYNAYSVSANLKGQKGILSFIAALLISEILSIVLLYYVL